MSATPERVQKLLAQAGIASRRNCEALISEGSVTINGQVAKLGDKATWGVDAIKVNGKLLVATETKVYLLFYKPRAVISMMVDNENRPNLRDYLGKVRERVFPIGRLDFNSEGLIILTNDGAFAENLQKREDIPRVYTVKVKGHATEEAMRRLEKGARLEHRMVRPHSVRKLRGLESKTQLQIVIQGGGAVDIRALCEMKGLLVDKITRTAVGHLTLRGLVPGHFRYLKASQALALLEQPELGLKRLEREEESEKPKGQRNFHAKKESNLAEGEQPARERDRSAERMAAVARKPVAAPRDLAEKPKRAFTGEKRTAVRPLDKPRTGFKPAGPREERSFGGDRAERPRRDDRSFGRRDDRAPRSDRGERPSFGAKRDDRAPRSDRGERPSFGAKRDDRGERPSFGGDRGAPRRRAGAAPQRTGGARSSDFAGGEGGRTGYGVFKPRSEKSWGDQPRGDRPSGGGDRPRRDDRPSGGGDRPRGGFKPRSGR